MPNWDIFHSDRLEVERNLSLTAIQAAVGAGEIVDEDLARTAGSGEPWVRLSEQPSLWALFSGGSDSLGDDDDDANGNGDGETAAHDPTSLRDMFDEDDEGDEPVPPPTLTAPKRRKDTEAAPLPSGVRKGTTEDLDPVGFPDSYDRDLELNLSDPRHVVTLDRDDDDYGDFEDDYDPEAEDEEAAGFTFSRAGAETVEELDLAAMVDVAFQLVLFFLVTASTIVFKTLEVPPPQAEEKKGATSQVIGMSATEAQKDNILVEVDANGEVKIDHEKAPNDFNGLIERLRKVRKETDRNGILLMAEPTTKHKNSVKVLDAAAEVGLALSMAKPVAAPEKAPVPPPLPAK
jgi:biopolymer transport protein ExbD